VFDRQTETSVYIQYSGSTSNRAPGPVARILAAIVAAAVLVVAFVLGFVFLISAVIALVVIGGVMSYRMRKYKSKGPGMRSGPVPGQPSGQTLEGEWQEVAPGRDDPGSPRGPGPQ